jgi:hypothetical protein
VVNAVASDKLVQGQGYSEDTGFPRLLLCNGKSVALPVLYNILQSQLENIRDTQSQISFQHQGGCDPLIGAASSEALFHGGYDFLVLVRSQRYSLFVHAKSLLNTNYRRSSNELFALRETNY